MSTPPGPRRYNWSGDGPVHRLTAREVRGARFNPPARRRDGYDTAQVRAFLTRVADELDRLHVELAAERETGDRIRTQLRRWQSQQAPQPGEDGYGHLPDPRPASVDTADRDPYPDRNRPAVWPPR